MMHFQQLHTYLRAFFDVHKYICVMYSYKPRLRVFCRCQNVCQHSILYAPSVQAGRTVAAASVKSGAAGSPMLYFREIENEFERIEFCQKWHFVFNCHSVVAALKIVICTPHLGELNKNPFWWYTILVRTDVCTYKILIDEKSVKIENEMTRLLGGKQLVLVRCKIYLCTYVLYVAMPFPPGTHETTETRFSKFFNINGKILVSSRTPFGFAMIRLESRVNS